MHAVSFRIVCALFDVFFCGFFCFKEFALVFSSAALRFINSVAGVSVVDDFSYFHLDLWVGECLSVPFGALKSG